MHQKLRRALLPGLGLVALLGGLSWFLIGRTSSPPPRLPAVAQPEAPAATSTTKPPAKAAPESKYNRLPPTVAARKLAKQAKQLALANETPAMSKPTDAPAPGSLPRLSTKVMGELARSTAQKRAFDDPALRRRLHTISTASRRLSDGSPAARRIPRITRADSVRDVQVDKKPR